MISMREVTAKQSIILSCSLNIAGDLKHSKYITLNKLYWQHKRKEMYEQKKSALINSGQRANPSQILLSGNSVVKFHESLGCSNIIIDK